MGPSAVEALLPTLLPHDDARPMETRQAVARAVAPHVGGLKLGLEFFMANGPAGVRAIGALGLPLFLDVKLHDIPNTVAGAARAWASSVSSRFTRAVSAAVPPVLAAPSADTASFASGQRQDQPGQTASDSSSQPRGQSAQTRDERGQPRTNPARTNPAQPGDTASARQGIFA